MPASEVVQLHRYSWETRMVNLVKWNWGVFLTIKSRANYLCAQHRMINWSDTCVFTLKRDTLMATWVESLSTACPALPQTALMRIQS